MSDYFIPLGGGDEIGASAYFLFVDGIRILLDCGARLKGEEVYPDYERLLREISDYSELDLILISHAHYDHIGSFAKIASLASHAEIIATQDTRQLMELQLLEFGRISGKEESESVKNERYRLAQNLFSRIQIRPVMKSFEMRGCRITLLPAGHMIGAVMIYLETENHKILYSGDFSIQTMFGLNEMRIPGEISTGLLLLNAPNTYLDEEEWQKVLSDKRTLPQMEDASEKTRETPCESEHYEKLESIIRRNLDRHRNVYLISKSIPKHLDLFYFLKSVFPDVPVFLELKSRQIADALSQMGYEVYGDHIIQPECEIPEQIDRSIVVGQEMGRAGCVSVFFDLYSLHASPAEFYDFVKKIGAEQVFLLHVYPDTKKKSLCDIIRLPGEARVDCSAIQAKNGFKYYIKGEKDMIYDQVFQEVMQNGLKKAQEMLESDAERKDASAIAMEWAAVYGSLQYPDCHPKDAYRMVKNVFREERFSYDEYIRALRNLNLDGEEKRKYIADLAEQGVTCLKKALNGDQKAVQEYEKFTEQLGIRDRKNRKIFFVGKSFVNFMILIDPDLKSEAYLPIVRAFNAKGCDRLLRELRDRLLRQYGLGKQKKTAREVLKQTEQVLSESSEIAGVAADHAGDELERLRFQNDNYKNSLELAQAMFDELQETIDEATEEARNSAIASFYSTMNSEKYGHLLDSLEMVEKRLAMLKEQKVKTPPQLLPLTIVFKQILNFIKDCGITPIDCTGREFETEVEGLAEYTYIGEAYTMPNEKKTVVVEHPGWKFGSTVISLPTVREKEEEVE